LSEPCPLAAGESSPEQSDEPDETDRCHR
jgi:hypothetical protein